MIKHLGRAVVGGRQIMREREEERFLDENMSSIALAALASRSISSSTFDLASDFGGVLDRRIVRECALT